MAVGEDNRWSVVWEWMDDCCHWTPYNSDVCFALERVHCKGLISAKLGDVDPSLSPYTVNLYEFSQLREDTGTCRPVRRQLYPSDWPPGIGISWQWCDNNKKDWNPYEILVQNAIESSFQKGASSLNLFQVDGKSPYVIELETMSQIRRNSGYRRGIRRQTVAPYPWASQANVGLTPNLENSETSESPEVQQETQSQSRRTRRRAPRASSSSVEAEGESSSQTTDKGMGKSFLQKIASLGSSKKLAKKGRGGSRKSSKTKAEGNADTREEATPESVVDGTVDTRNMLIAKFTQVTKAEASEDCCICCCDLSTPSDYDDDSTVVEFVQCKHMVHKACLVAMCNSSTLVDSIQCPICKKIYGEKRGNQPPGIMSHSVISTSLPGYPNCGTIIIQYHIRSGIQGPEHPNPGEPYSARGFPRCCYIPDNEKGRKVLRLLQVAWERRLVFAVGTSVTTGEIGTVTWNEIHHKTEFGSNYSGHGYPDENYLDNVLLELSLQGVVE